MTDTAKITLSLSACLVADLDFIGSHLGISRSGLVSEVLSGPVARMRRLAEAAPIAPGRVEPLRLRGDSADIVRHRIAALGGADEC